MTRYQAKELLPIIQAFAEGKQIQLMHNGTWKYEESDKFDFNHDPSHYRIKPTLQYRPWKMGEAINAGLCLLKHQHENSYYIPVYLSERGVVVICKPSGGFPIESAFVDWETLQKFYTHSVDNGKTLQVCGVPI